MLKGLLGHFPSGQGKHNNRSVAFRQQFRMNIQNRLNGRKNWMRHLANTAIARR